MQKLRFLFSLATVCVSFIASAQFNVSGVVLDSATREPLSGASVFCQNTTLGTATNKQGEFSLQLKSGGYDLIFSYTGYEKQVVRATGNVTRFEILLVKEEKSMGEVVIKSSNEVKDGWEKYGGFFVDNFIGATPNAAKCTLLNPEALHFYFLKKSNKLRVLVTEPLRISNEALGYNLTYQLDSFIYNYNNDISSYRGFCLYAEMEGSDSLQSVWAKNRKNAYEGSKLHFMRSYYDSTLTEEGWVIEMLDDFDKKKFNKIPNPYDSLFYNGIDSITNEIEINFPKKISVTYTKKRPEPEYLKKNRMSLYVIAASSYIDMLDWIAIKENGYYYEQKDWITQGYWSWKNLADQLPYDYNPPE